jgi:hypothetical protein
MKDYNVGDRVLLSAVVKFANPRRSLAVLKFPDGSETQPMKFETIEALETDAQSMLYVPENTTARPAEVDTTQQEA